MITISNSKITYLYYLLNPKIDSKFVKSTVSFLSYHNNSLKDILSEKEMSHMLDVRRLMKNLWINCSLILYASVASVIILNIIFTKKISKKHSMKFIRKIGLISLILGVLLLTLLIITFSYSFEKFHEIFFPQGNYTFPPNSVLISNLPESFFRRFLIISFAETTLIFIITIEVIDRITKVIYKKYIKKIY